jgi:F0F1-type ATP synthase delta subunit
MQSKTAKLAATLIAHLKTTGELDLLPQLVEALSASPEYRRAKNKVVVTSAVKLESTELKHIEAYVQKQVGEDYSLENMVDPELVAGFTLQVNDTLIDASFLGKINAVQNTLYAKD